MRDSLKITKVRNTNGGKCLVMYRQEVQTPNTNANVMVGILNATDERFNSSKRAAIVVGMHADIARTYPAIAAQVTALVGQPVGTETEVSLEVPQMNGQDLNISITENTTQAWSGQEPKRAGKEGPIMYSGGLPIYSHTNIVLGNPTHVFLTADVVEATATPIQSGISAEQPTIG